MLVCNSHKCDSHKEASGLACVMDPTKATIAAEFVMKMMKYKMCRDLCWVCVKRRRAAASEERIGAVETA
jgi:hypothetical protein